MRYLSIDFGGRVATLTDWIGCAMTNHSKSRRQHHSAPGPNARAALGVAVAWTLAWKSASLWRAAKNDSKPWFGVLLLSNTLGILDAIYLFGVDGARRRTKRDAERTERKILAETGEPPQLGHTVEM